MAQQVVTRTQRRVERKQLLIAVILIIAVAGCSFYLGMLFGRQSRNDLNLVDDIGRPGTSVIAQVKPPPKPGDDPSEKPEKLTFYDNLPKGKQAPLGSGINLPPQTDEVKDEKLPEHEKTVKATSLQVQSASKIEDAPSAVSGGAFVVQIASFRTDVDAKKLTDRLRNYKLTTFIETADLGEKGTWHRVLSGPYATRDNADAVARLLSEKERLSALVRQR